MRNSDKNKSSGNKSIKICKLTEFGRTVQTSAMSPICRGLFCHLSLCWPRSALLSPCQDYMFTHRNIMFSSALSLVDASDIGIRTINTKTKHDLSTGTRKDETTRLFICFVFRSVLGLCLDYDLMLMLTTTLMSQAWLHSFVLHSVLTLCLCICSSVNQALEGHSILGRTSK